MNGPLYYVWLAAAGKCGHSNICADREGCEGISRIDAVSRCNTNRFAWMSSHEVIVSISSPPSSRNTANLLQTVWYNLEGDDIRTVEKNADVLINA